MKFVWIWALLALTLTACAAEETFETVSDEQVLSVMAQPRAGIAGECGSTGTGE